MTSPTAPVFSDRIRKHKIARANKMRVKNADFLATEAIAELIGRLTVTNRSFPVAIDLLSPVQSLAKKMQALENVGAVQRIPAQPGSSLDLNSVKDGSVNLITSLFGLHWQQDIRSLLHSTLQKLKPDGLFIAAIPGGATLKELRSSLIKAEVELVGSASLRIDPFGEVRQYGDLMQQIGFSLAVADTEIITARYADIYGLIRDLRAMAATSTLEPNPKKTPRTLFERADQIYLEEHGDDDGRIRASFEIIYLAGWKPDASQQQPMKPGSAKNKLSDFL